MPDDERYGAEIRVERRGNEVRLIFVVETKLGAAQLQRELSHQLKAGVLYLALTGVAAGEEGR